MLVMSQLKTLQRRVEHAFQQSGEGLALSCARIVFYSF